MKHIGGDTATQVVRFQNGSSFIGYSAPYSIIAPGESKQLTFEWNTTGIKGNRTLIATVDPGNIIAEWIENNNQRQQVITLR